jgi:prolyl-tRNA editing enzyme YbaK/EbsC (Cys-tRNA(Pro) deacylase)
VADHPAIERVRSHAAQHRIALEVRRFPAGTHTAEDAAHAIGCDAAQIVKSLVFLASGGVVVVLVSGADRVDEAKLAGALGVPSPRRATAKEARERTGFVVGGVPPFGHDASTPVLVDEALLAHETVWAAAGLPDAVFPIAPEQLVRAAGARIVNVRLSPAGIPAARPGGSEGMR